MNDNYTIIEHLGCVCGDPGCILRVVLDKEEYPVLPEISLDVQLSSAHLSFFQRLHYGLRFIFTGRSPTYGVWGGTVLSEESLEKLSKLFTTYKFLRKLRMAKHRKEKLKRVEGRE